MVIATISGDAILGAAAAILVALMAITTDQVRRRGDKIDAEIEAVDTKVSDARERLRGVESTVAFLVTGQRAVIAQTAQTHHVVAEVHEQLDTVNGLAVGELLDRQEGRRIQDIPKDQRSAAEQNYLRDLEEGPNGH